MRQQRSVPRAQVMDDLLWAAGQREADGIYNQRDVRADREHASPAHVRPSRRQIVRMLERLKDHPAE